MWQKDRTMSPDWCKWGGMEDGEGVLLSEVSDRLSVFPFYFFGELAGGLGSPTMTGDTARIAGRGRDLDKL